MPDLTVKLTLPHNNDETSFLKAGKGPRCVSLANMEPMCSLPNTIRNTPIVSPGPIVPARELHIEGTIYR